ncbi:thiamine pyrophosphate-binding protein [Amorphus sp. 3PC139-8]|uniref:thiamine pyrophosphate-binding protein n=1 Tax=Amorphus sp. 3PC139-8 TaxID=2735676 RepID=UPI00345C9350
MTASDSPAYGSDVIADLLQVLGVPHLAINPGASFRGLHDSLVNRTAPEAPDLILTLHEAQAVAIAHGYAKVTGEPMGVVLHANVGLMNAVMAIYDAWADRVPMLILGATGAVDAARRRPWIEWIHTSRDQAAMVRSFVKWDDQPVSVAAAQEALLRGWTITRTVPSAPVYICLDTGLQEDPIETAPAPPELARYAPPAEAGLDMAALQRVRDMLSRSERPLLLVGRHERSEAAWADRIALAQAIGAAVLCDQKCGVGFPSDHPAFIAAPAQYPDARTAKLLAEADLVISLDWPDLKGLLGLRPDRGEGLATIVVSPDERLHNGWSFDHFPYPEADLRLPIRPEVFTRTLLPLLESAAQSAWTIPPSPKPNWPTAGAITLPALADAFDRARGDQPVCLTRLTFGLPDAQVRFTHPLDCIGYDGGGGIGSTPGITVGAALALKGTGRLPVAILGDGDLAMGSQALWTAAAQKLPALFVVNNNRAFYNDVEHQEAVARRRNRPVENKTIGMALEDPPLDLLAIARGHGCQAFGPVRRVEELDAALAQAFAAAQTGPVVLDVEVLPPAPRA